MQFLRLLRKAGILAAELAIVDSMVRSFGGGEATGPSPVDRRKLRTKHTAVADGSGAPLVIHTAPANASDRGQILAAIADFPPSARQARLATERSRCRLRGSRLRQRGNSERPGCPGHRAGHRSSRRRHGSSLGRIRWVVEPTISWFKGSAASASATTGSFPFSTPGTRSPQPLFASASRCGGDSLLGRSCQEL